MDHVIKIPVYLIFGLHQNRKVKLKMCAIAFGQKHMRKRMWHDQWKVNIDGQLKVFNVLEEMLD